MSKTKCDDCSAHRMTKTMYVCSECCNTGQSKFIFGKCCKAKHETKCHLRQKVIKWKRASQFIL